MREWLPSYVVTTPTLKGIASCDDDNDDDDDDDDDADADANAHADDAWNQSSLNGPKYRACRRGHAVHLVRGPPLAC